MTKITEKMLLDGYDGVCNDGITAQSIVKEERIWWTYRCGPDGEYDVVTDDRAKASHILLEYDRVGDIPLAERLNPMQAATADKHRHNCRKINGDEI